MKKSYNLNELILFVSGGKRETDLNDMDIACQTDERKLNESELLISGLSISPDKRIISNILNYSRALAVVNTKNAGNFNLMMN